MLGALLVLVLWVGYGYWQFRGSMDAANDRVDASTRAALTPGGSPLTDSSTTLVLGSDVRPGGSDGRSDSIMLVRVDPGRNSIAQLSIPRDLRVTIPGHGDDRINAAYTLGGPALAIKTVQDLTGIPINHVVQVDFAGFRELVDALGGVTIDNPTKIISNSFDGHPWRFGRGRLHLDGRHALAYARVRENIADPSDNDLTRGLRQQRVLQAIAHGLASPGTLFRLPSVGRTIGKPLTTDLTADDLMALGWRQTAGEQHAALPPGRLDDVGGRRQRADRRRREPPRHPGRARQVRSGGGDARRHVLRRLHLAERQDGVLLSDFLEDELSLPELFESALLDSELLDSEPFDSDFEPELPSPEEAAALSFEPESDELPDSDDLSPLVLLPPLP